MSNSLRDRLFIALQHSLPQALLSQLAGKLADARTPWLKSLLIQQFARHYRIDMSDAVEPRLDAYPSFNEFFTRALAPHARPLGEHLVSPADGEISQLGAITAGQLLQAKGRHYSIDALLGGSGQWSAPFQQGQFATVYLSPRDYHRVHMPCAGTLKRTVYIPGQLFSVNQTTAANVDQLFARNERLVCHFDTESGPMALVLVGAMIVAGIETVWAGQVEPHATRIQRHDFSAGIRLEKGQEMGRFRLGSTVITCFGQGVAPLAGLSAGDAIRQGNTLFTPDAPGPVVPA
ncbi:archaetidylserine decarboxylase [Carnimonas nigrificans]|uniref:archaetidylserine decarboxylase n=1 Tax=Carnimonas nigrificans TaxID=64323 RepID=UPI0004B02D23|nr:archaetidylserine decarboxylase [Carnimonas nigrificans]